MVCVFDRDEKFLEIYKLRSIVFSCILGNNYCNNIGCGVESVVLRDSRSRRFIERWRGDLKEDGRDLI